MKKTHFPVIIGSGLLSAASLIAGLASADIDSNKHGAGKYAATTMLAGWLPSDLTSTMTAKSAQ